MKKLILTYSLVVASLVGSAANQANVPAAKKAAVTAATIVTDNFNPDTWESKIKKQNADIVNPKKKLRSATWLARGKFFVDVYNAPVNGFYVDMDTKSATLMYGRSRAANVKYEGEAYSKSTYTYSVGIYGGGKLKCWYPTWETSLTALDESLESYLKAYELDPKVKDKTAEGIELVAKQYQTLANMYYGIKDYASASKNYATAYQTRLKEPLATIDTTSLFLAGYMNLALKKYPQAVNFLKKSLELGDLRDGELYMYIFHCYYGQKKYEESINILLEGMQKYPEKEEYTNALLAAVSGEGIDAEKVIAAVTKAIAVNPKNSDLYNALGGMYDKLNDLEKALESFSKAVEIAPQDYRSNFNLGLLYLKVADKMHEDLSKIEKITAKEYNAKVEDINKVYVKSIDPLEMAFEQNKTNKGAAELLKNVYFRLRNEDGMMEKHEKYKAISESLQ